MEKIAIPENRFQENRLSDSLTLTQGGLRKRRLTSQAPGRIIYKKPPAFVKAYVWSTGQRRFAILSPIFVFCFDRFAIRFTPPQPMIRALELMFRKGAWDHEHSERNQKRRLAGGPRSGHRH